MSLRVAVVSPFLDKQHGTERCVAEQVERLARDYGYEIHIYSQRVEDVALDGKAGTGNEGEGMGYSVPGPRAPVLGRIIWHRIPSLPGPHLLKYAWWFVANHVWRWWQQRVRGVHVDLVYSPGVNCLDADVVAVHIVFAAFWERVKSDLSFTRSPWAFWPRLLHRHLYYRLIMALERRIYPNPRVSLLAVSGLTAQEVKEFYGREDVRVVHNSVDMERFSPARREALRPDARRWLNLQDSDFCLLLIGNDWKKKGLPTLIKAVGSLRDYDMVVCVVGRDDRTPYRSLLQQTGVESRVRFLAPRPDVEYYYAAADVYVGPSLHDSFAFPPLEAMACGLPVITSVGNGGAEIVTHGVDGFVLQDPRDPEELAHILALLYEDPALRLQVGERAARTARKYTWGKNVAHMHDIFTETLKRKERRP